MQQKINHHGYCVTCDGLVSGENSVICNISEDEDGHRHSEADGQGKRNNTVRQADTDHLYNDLLLVVILLSLPL